MRSVQELIGKRTLMEEVLLQADESQVKNGLAAYDTVIMAVSNYQKKRKQDAENIKNEIRINERNKILRHINATYEDIKKETKNINGDTLERIIEKINGHNYDEIKDNMIENRETSLIYSYVDALGHRPAYIFILNYDENNELHKSNVFGGNYKWPHIGKKISTHKEELSKELKFEDEKFRIALYEASYLDNAIAVNPEGIIKATELYIKADPQEIINVNPEKNPYFYKRFGFSRKVHARHFSSISGSYKMPGTLLLTLGESGIVRLFHNGIIKGSTDSEEYDSIKELK